MENAGAIAADEKVRMPGRIDIQIMASRKWWFSATLEKEWKMPPRAWSVAKPQFAVIFREPFIRAMAA